MSFKIQIRRDTAANWTLANPVLLEAEMGYETDTFKAKMGDGTTTYNLLPYWTDTIKGIDTYGPTGSIQPGATGIGITGNLVTSEIVGGIPYYSITGATTRYYGIRFEYDSNDDLVTAGSTILSGGQWTSAGLVVDSYNGPPTATFNFANELTPPKNIYGYFYNANLDRYVLTTFGKGNDGLVISSVLNSNQGSPIVTNTFFSDFSAGNGGNNEIEIIMTLSNYGGAQKTGFNNAHAYIIFSF